MAGVQGEAASTLAGQGQNVSNLAGLGQTIQGKTPDTMMAGGKDGAKPTQTAMGTPIIYGKTYLNNLSKDYVAPLAETVVGSAGDSGGDGGVGGGDSVGIGSNSTTASADNSGNSVGEGVGPGSDGSGGAGSDGVGADGAYAYGTTSVPNYAYGTTSVANYARGTMGVDDDPWAWTKVQTISAPLSADIRPSNEQAMARMPDKTEQQLGALAMGKGVDAATKGIDTAYKAYGSSAPLSAMGTSELAAADMALGGAGGTAGATALTAGTGASGAAALGGEAALAAMGPVGMVIGGALLAKKLGIF